MPPNILQNLNGVARLDVQQILWLAPLTFAWRSPKERSQRGNNSGEPREGMSPRPGLPGHTPQFAPQLPLPPGPHPTTCDTSGPTASDSIELNESHECVPCHRSPCVQSAFGLCIYVRERRDALQFSKADTLATKRNDAVFCSPPCRSSPRSDAKIKTFIFREFVFDLLLWVALLAPGSVR